MIIYWTNPTETKVDGYIVEKSEKAIRGMSIWTCPTETKLYGRSDNGLIQYKQS